MINKILNGNIFNVANNAYNAFNANNKIRGTVLYYKDNVLELEMENNKIFSGKLKNSINANIGDIILLDKKDVSNSSIKENKDSFAINTQEKDKYENVLKNLNMSISEDNIYAVKVLEKNDVVVNKENIESFDYNKKCLNKISNDLNYDKAIKLADNDVDIEKDSLQKISDELETIKEEEKGFSFKDIFGKKELTTEEAGEIATEIYGSSMGKDITDIIKALYKEGISITKDGIEKVYDIFYKLDNLKNMNDSTFVDVIKNNIEASIDNIYKLKNFVKSSVIQPAINNGRAYLNLADNNFQNIDVTNLKKDIENILSEIKLPVTNENIDIASELIKKGMSVDEENMENILNLKNSMNNISSKLDYETAGIMLKDMDISKVNINKVSMALDALKSTLANIKSDDKSSLEFLNRVNTDIIAYQIKNDIPLDIKNLKNTYDLYSNDKIYFKKLTLKEDDRIKEYVDKNIHALDVDKNDKENVFKSVKSIISNEFGVTKSSIEKTYNAYINVKNIRENLNKDMIVKLDNENLKLEDMNIKELSKYIDRYNMQKLEHKDLVDRISTLKEKDFCIANLIKNDKDISLKEIDKIASFIKNKDQLGHKIEQIYTDLEKQDTSRENQSNLKKSLKEMMEKLKDSDVDIEKYYDELKKEIENTKSTINVDVYKNVKKKCDDSLNIIESILRDNSDEKMLQIPILLNEKFTNLNMYYKERKNATKEAMKKDIDIILNLDTPNLGNVNMHLNVENEEVKVKFVMDNKENQNYLNNNKEVLEELLNEIGYNVSILDENKGHEENIFSNNEIEIKSNSYLDITI